MNGLIIGTDGPVGGVDVDTYGGNTNVAGCDGADAGGEIDAGCDGANAGGGIDAECDEIDDVLDSIGNDAGGDAEGTVILCNITVGLNGVDGAIVNGNDDVVG